MDNKIIHQVKNKPKINLPETEIKRILWLRHKQKVTTPLSLRIPAVPENQVRKEHGRPIWDSSVRNYRWLSIVYRIIVWHALIEFWHRTLRKYKKLNDWAHVGNMRNI